jgi:D-glycero-beta-D-manno-heptose-7-phosphate kinase
MPFSSIQEVFTAFENLKVLVIGDVMIDSYIYGNAGRISPEAPVPVVNVSKRENRLGGAANVALNIQSLGATPILCSIVGEELDGQIFLDLLEKRNITSKGIVRSKERITTVKTRVLAGFQHMLRVDSETDKSLSPLEQHALMDRIRDLASGCDVIIFEDYDKGVLNPSVISQTITMANEMGIPTVVDPKKRNFMSYSGASLFKPNLRELKEGLKLEFDHHDLDQLSSAVNQLNAHMPVEKALITLSDRGVYLTDHVQSIHYPAHIRRIADVSGAGDTVVSIAALCEALHLSLEVQAELSNLGGGLVCQHLGVMPIEKESLLQEALKNEMILKHLTI